MPFCGIRECRTATAQELRRLVSVLAALVMAVSLLTGCGTKTAENVEKQEDAQTIQVYLWSTSLYETYAPYIQSQLPDVNIEFIVGNNDLDFYKFLQENGGLPDIITSCRFSLHDAAPLKDSLMNLALTNEAGAVQHLPQQLQKRGRQRELAAGLRRCPRLCGQPQPF